MHRYDHWPASGLLPSGETRQWLAGLSNDVARLPEVMERQHVDGDIIQRSAGWIAEVAIGLADARMRTWK